MSQPFVLISIYIITMQLTILFSPSTSHYSSPSPPATPFNESPPTSPSSTYSEWLSAHATYYSVSDDTRDGVDGACGYGDTHRDGYGITGAAALSETLFVRGQICGGCFELRCLEEDVPFDKRWCVSGSSVVVTATSFCAPNYGFDAESDGGYCNPPKQHFVLPVEAFEKIAIWKGGNMPVHYRRIKCIREGGMRFTITGSGIFNSVLISNVAGIGDIVGVKVKGSRTGWIPMGRNWGQIWHVNALLQNQPLSFEVTSSDGVTITSYNVAPKNWTFGQTFEGKQFKS
ncbi:putative expansin/Lol pI [Medicago truncatula]|uniref:Expansin n=1 Tax=Medicago truncatula TaxID=3880 RepID=G7J7Z0_MEDTR|nr:expansin-A13 [Medicago truncatula]AES70884.1 expansin A1 [Medicago truncatula]RHN68073.1 putative expansin/Lol pI [Medicago truncatula]